MRRLPLAIISLFGMLAALIAAPFIFVGLIGVIALLIVVNVGALWAQRPLEATACPSRKK